jgi:hypothetical protein
VALLDASRPVSRAGAMTLCNNADNERFERNAKHFGRVLERPDDGARQGHLHLSPWAKFGTFAFIRRSSQLSGQLV